METTFTESLEIKEIAIQLQEKYYAFIGYIDLEIVCFAEMEGYKSKKASVYLMSGITQGWVRDIIFHKFNTKEKLYCLAVWTEEWSELQKSKKEWIIFKCLYSISPSLDGKIRAVDVQDYGFILEYFIRSGFGPYWETKDDLPSLLDSNDGLPLIIPLED
jgi:hypothetical protein